MKAFFVLLNDLYHFCILHDVSISLCNCNTWDTHNNWDFTNWCPMIRKYCTPNEAFCCPENITDAYLSNTNTQLFIAVFYKLRIFHVLRSGHPRRVAHRNIRRNIRHNALTGLPRLTHASIAYLQVSRCDAEHQ